jgi:hypothetical protein
MKWFIDKESDRRVVIEKRIFTRSVKGIITALVAAGGGDES